MIHTRLPPPPEETDDDSMDDSTESHSMKKKKQRIARFIVPPEFIYRSPQQLQTPQMTQAQMMTVMAQFYSPPPPNPPKTTAKIPKTQNNSPQKAFPVELNENAPSNVPPKSATQRVPSFFDIICRGNLPTIALRNGSVNIYYSTK